jgi:hypothetical protein
LAFEELVEWLYQVGPVTSAGMGMQPVSWQELNSWNQACGHDCTPWELEQIRMLSMAYLDQFTKAEEPSCPAPWIDPNFVDHAALGERIKKQFRAFNRSRRGN